MGRARPVPNFKHARGVISAPAAAAEATAHSDYTSLTADDHTHYVLESTVTAKGALLVASANATITQRSVGANDTRLTADSAQTTGMKWA